MSMTAETNTVQNNSGSDFSKNIQKKFEDAKTKYAEAMQQYSEQKYSLWFAQRRYFENKEDKVLAKKYFGLRNSVFSSESNADILRDKVNSLNNFRYKMFLAELA